MTENIVNPSTNKLRSIYLTVVVDMDFWAKQARVPVQLLVALPLVALVAACEHPLQHTQRAVKPVAASVVDVAPPPSLPLPTIMPSVTIVPPPPKPVPIPRIEPTVDFAFAAPPTPEPVVVEASTEPAADEATDGVLELLGSEVAPGNRTQLTWSATETYTGMAIPTPVLVVNGAQPGPTLCLTAAVHGDELNGIETVRQIIHNLNAAKLKGAVVGVPIVNIQGFQRHTRYLPDRRDLNRFFPGNPTGSSASRIAHSFFTQIVQHCDSLVDLHTGSFHRTNLPQLRADLRNEEVVALTKGFGSTVILHSEGAQGSLRRAAVEAGIPAVTVEAGAPLQLEEAEVKHSVKSIQTLLDTLGMYNKRSLWGNPEPAYYASHWVRSDNGGILFSQVKLGKRVKQGDVLGTVTDPISNKQSTITSPFNGRILGKAMNQFVMPGYATFHIGIEAEVDEATQGDNDPAMDHSVAFSGEPEDEASE